MKETYMVNLPKKIVFGDPLYFEEFKGGKAGQPRGRLFSP